MPKFHVECQEVRTMTYEVEASDIADARRKFVEDGGKRVSDRTTEIDISDINPAT